MLDKTQFLKFSFNNYCIFWMQNQKFDLGTYDPSYNAACCILNLNNDILFTSFITFIIIIYLLTGAKIIENLLI